MHTTVFSGAIVGVDGLVVEVEIDISRGIPCFSIVGLPNTAVRESRERVTAAIKNSGWDFPLERITVNLAPADVKKEGAAFDLAIAVGVLIASGQVDLEEKNIGFQRGDTSGSLTRASRGGESTARVTVGSIAETVFLGELALDGSLRKVPGVLPVLTHARACGFKRAVFPADNFHESSIVSGLDVYGCRRLVDVVRVVTGAPASQGPDRGDVEILVRKRDQVIAPPEFEENGDGVLDMSEVYGQESAKRALLVAAAGGHHLLMIGPPGAGKTMLAKRFSSLLPPLSRRAMMETTMIYSIVGLLNGRPVINKPPLRAPHHSASDAGLIGGGSLPRPGEVTLAHNGVLFLDELPEFKRHVLETLREPLEEGKITISRAKSTVTFPARFQLIAAMNPCPCGYLGSSDYQCRCGPIQVERYLAKISGPLLDRISIHVTVRPVDVDALRYDRGGESSAAMRERAVRARDIQRRRFPDANAEVHNAVIPESMFGRFCTMDPDAEDLLYGAQKQLRISARARAHIIRVARTIADLEGAETITESHVAEAVQYRVPEVR